MRLSIRHYTIAVAAIAALWGLYLHLVRESMRPSVGSVESDGTFRSRRMRDEEIRAFDWTLHESVIGRQQEPRPVPLIPHR
jgi:hypothetical protein